MRPSILPARAMPVLIGGLALGLSGCAGPGPKLFPPVAVQRAVQPDGSSERWYDTNGNHLPDYRETLSADGRLIVIAYDCDEDGQVEQTVTLDEVPPAERRYLAILLDSVPFDVVRDLWNQGRFRMFPRPSRTISPFPVMTDLSFSTFFGVTPVPGVESEYYDGRKLRNGYDVYAHEGNAPWVACTDYHLPQFNHGIVYLDVEPWFAHELRRIQDTFLQSRQPLTIGYCVGTSGLGAVQARDGHVAGLIMVDRLCQELTWRTRGRARFTLMSDHGHYFSHEESRRVPLREMLERFGYRVRDRLRRPEDVVVPEFAMVSAASIYTMTPGRVARDVVQIAGVDLAAYMQNDELIVVGREGVARIMRSEAGFRYVPEAGDPLRLAPILAKLAEAGQVSPDGWIADAALFEATADHVYPDAVARLWRAFHGLVAHTPDVLVSLQDGFHAGSKFQTEVISLVGVHGSLRPASSFGFAMTTEGELPPVIRMENLRESFQAVGVPFGK